MTLHLASSLLLLVGLVTTTTATSRGNVVKPDTCPYLYDFTMQYTMDDVVDALVVPMDTDRNTLEYRERAYAFFDAQYGIALDPAVPGPQNVPGFAHLPWQLTDQIRMSVYAIDAQTYAPWQGRFPIRNTELIDDGYQLVTLADVTVHGRFGRNEGVVVPAGSLLLFGEYRLFIDGEHVHTFHYQSNEPVTVAPVTGLGVINCDITSDVWGSGITRGAFELRPTEDGRERVLFRYTMTFPKYREDNQLDNFQCTKLPAVAPKAPLRSLS